MVVPSTPSVSTLDSQQSSNNEITNDEMIDVLELKDVDVADVLKLLSKKSGLNIIANQDVNDIKKQY